MGYYGFNNNQGISGRHADGKSRIFVSSMVAHTWANQSVDCGRNGKGSLYFKGKTIYSYGTHWPLATITDRKSADGKTIVVVNNTHAATEGRGWGNSTNRHLRYVQNALRGHMDYECVAGDTDSTMRAITDPDAAFGMIAARILFDMHARKIELCNMRKKVWSGYLELDHSERVNALHDANLLDFCNVTMIALPVYDLAAMRAEIQAAVDAYMVGEPKREKDRAARAKRQCLERLAKWVKTNKDNGLWVPYRQRVTDKEAWEALTVAMQNYDKVKWISYYTHLQIAQLREEIDHNFNVVNPDAQHIAYQRRYGNRQALSINEWLVGKQGTLGYYYDDTVMRKRNERLETSRGVEVPWQHAVRCFMLAVCCYSDKTEYVPTQPIQIGHFRLDKIDADGTLHAGCHHLKFKDMVALACVEEPQTVAHMPARYPVPAVI